MDLQATVNQFVVGSNPTPGDPPSYIEGFFIAEKDRNLESQVPNPAPLLQISLT